MFHILGGLILFARTVLSLKSHERSSLVLPKPSSSPFSVCRSVSITAQISGLLCLLRSRSHCSKPYFHNFSMKRIALSLHVDNVEVACVHSHANLRKTWTAWSLHWRWVTAFARFWLNVACRPVQFFYCMRCSRPYGSTLRRDFL